MRPSVQPWKATACPDLAASMARRLGKERSEISAEVMCQQGLAPPPRFHPWHNQPRADPPAAATAACSRSVCRSVPTSIMPPCGAKTPRP
jgi:hypothetical protein